ncbi:hypothetical protein KKG44_00225 [Patescibacteria group bacterium]|nr:hypothetical protein [Patescibacteria group bacterium]
MRHNKVGRKFGREKAPRKAMLDNLATSLVVKYSPIIFLITTLGYFSELVNTFNLVLTMIKFDWYVAGSLSNQKAI